MKKGRNGGREARQKKLIEGRIDIAYDSYRFVGGQCDGIFQAIMYLGRRKIHETVGDSVAFAVDAFIRSVTTRIRSVMEAA